MSTTFGVYIPSIDEVKPIARRRGIGNGKVHVWFTNEVAELLDDDTPVVAIDNSNQGIWTIGGLKARINKNE